MGSLLINLELTENLVSHSERMLQIGQHLEKLDPILNWQLI